MKTAFIQQLKGQNVEQFPASLNDCPVLDSIPSNVYSGLRFYDFGSDPALVYMGKEIDRENGRITFNYRAFDSEEGDVFIGYYATGGNVDCIEDGFDVEVLTGSDCWGLDATRASINNACKLHVTLGHDKPYSRD